MGQTKKNRPTTEARASAKEDPIHQIQSENKGSAEDLPSAREMDKALKELRRKPMFQTDSGPSCGRTATITRMDCEIQRGEKPQAPQIGRGKPENLCSYRRHGSTNPLRGKVVPLGKSHGGRWESHQCVKRKTEIANASVSLGMQARP